MILYFGMGLGLSFVAGVIIGLLISRGHYMGGDGE